MRDPELRRLRAFFISGTDTGIGKTVVTGALLRALRLAGFAAQAVKPIQTGLHTHEALTSPMSDASVYAAAVADIQTVSHLAPAAVLHCFSLPASPHLAAEAEDERLNADTLCRDIRKHWQRETGAQLLLLESAGGICAPLNNIEDMRDIAAGLDIPVILVCANRLGTLSQLFCACSALEEKGLELAGVVLVQSRIDDGTTTQILADNLRISSKRLETVGLRVPVLALPSLPKNSDFWEHAASKLAPLAERMHTFPRLEKHAQSFDLVSRDRNILWHPYASAIEPPTVEVASRSMRNRIVLEDGRELVDGMSSWWAAAHGYNPPRLLRALRHQAGRMPHVMFGGFTHAPAVELAERLVQHMPEGLARIFLADSGSVAVEVAMKMALQYQQGRGQYKRVRFLAPYGGYHGDTLGAMSVCDPVTGMHSLFSGLLPQQIFIERPACRFDVPFEPASLDAARHMLEKRGDEIAAVILEPIVQGAGGMWFYHPDYLRGLAALCKAADILLIFDEIATGFGRTGKMFAAEWAEVSPDILCCGKTLAGGLLSLAATACTERVARGICTSGRVFMHGPTFMANPLACSTALANLQILEENHWRRQVADIQKNLTTGLAPCRTLPDVTDVRVLGAIGVVEMRDQVNMAALQNFFVKKGVWIRPFNRLIYLMPPYISPLEDVEQLCAAVLDALVNGAHINN